MTDEEEARSAFDRLRSAVDACVDDKSPEVAWHLARQLGLQGEENPSTESMSGEYEHRRSWDGDLELKLHFRWWDPSKTFSVRPDRHVLTLTLLRGRDVLAKHSAVYDD